MTQLVAEQQQQQQQQQQQMQQQLPMAAVPPPRGVNLSMIIDFLLQQTYHDLTVLSELLPRKSDIERKIDIIKFAKKAHDQFIRLLALVKWASQNERMDKFHTLSTYLDQQSFYFIDTADTLARMARETLAQARLPLFSLPTACDVLTTGKFNRLPRCIKTKIVQEDSLKPSDKAKTLKRLNEIIQHRLVISQVPPRFTSIKIAEGKVLMTADKEFEISLTVMNDDLDTPWRLLNIDILMEEHQTGLGKSLVHGLQLHTLHHMLQARLMVETHPLLDLYNSLHHFCLSLQLEVFHTQTNQLIALRWGDYVRVDEYKPGVVLRLSYCRPVGMHQTNAKLISESPKVCIKVSESSSSGGGAGERSGELGGEPGEQRGEHSSLVVNHTPDIFSGLSAKQVGGLILSSNCLSIEKIYSCITKQYALHKLQRLQEKLNSFVYFKKFSSLETTQPVLIIKPFLNCIPSELVKISLHPKTGHFRMTLSDINKSNFALVASLEALLRHSDVDKFSTEFHKLRCLIYRTKCKRCVVMHAVDAYESMPISNYDSHLLSRLPPTKLYLKFKRHNEFCLVLTIDVESTEEERPIKEMFYLLRVKAYHQSVVWRRVPDKFCRNGYVADSMIRLDTSNILKRRSLERLPDSSSAMCSVGEGSSNDKMCSVKEEEEECSNGQGCSTKECSNEEMENLNDKMMCSRKDEDSNVEMCSAKEDSNEDMCTGNGNSNDKMCIENGNSNVEMCTADGNSNNIFSDEENLNNKLCTEKENSNEIMFTRAENSNSTICSPGENEIMFTGDDNLSNKICSPGENSNEKMCTENSNKKLCTEKLNGILGTENSNGILGTKSSNGKLDTENSNGKLGTETPNEEKSTENSIEKMCMGDANSNGKMCLVDKKNCPGLCPGDKRKPRKCEEAITQRRKKKKSRSSDEESKVLDSANNFDFTISSVVSTTCFRLPYIELCQQLSRAKVTFSVPRENDVNYQMILLDFPKLTNCSWDDNLALKDQLTSCVVHMDMETFLWRVSYHFEKTVLPYSACQVTSDPIQFSYSPVYVEGENIDTFLVDQILADWRGLVKLYGHAQQSEKVVELMRGEYSMTSLELMTYDMKSLVYRYVSNSVLTLTFHSILEKYEIRLSELGQTGVDFCPHFIIQTHLANEFNIHNNLQFVLKILHYTYHPLKALKRVYVLPCISPQDRSVTNNFTIIAHSSTNIKVIYKNCYAIDVFFIESLVAMRDGTVYRTVSNRAMQGFRQIPNLNSFLRGFADHPPFLNQEASTTQGGDVSQGVEQFNPTSQYRQVFSSVGIGSTPVPVFLSHSGFQRLLSSPAETGGGGMTCLENFFSVLDRNRIL